MADIMVRETNILLTQPLPSGLATVERDIARACKEARRDRASVSLIAVSKTFDATAISPVIDAGQRAFGENRVQEAKAKWPELMSAYQGIVLHLIGPLQSNKAKEAVALFDAIHSVDRPSICEALAKEINSQKKRPELFVQLNTGEEPQKAGVAPGDADAFIANCREKYGLTISGLMCIPPVNEAPAPHFALTAKIAARNGLKNLSMGMSADFAVAIQLGATHVRVGSAIFGHRGRVGFGPYFRHNEERKRRRVRRSSASEGGSNPFFLAVARWIASRRLSSGACSHDPVARNDEV